MIRGFGQTINNVGKKDGKRVGKRGDVKGVMWGLQILSGGMAVAEYDRSEENELVITVI